MSHKAVVTSITVKPHPNADRIQLATTRFGNYQIIVGLDQEDQELGIFFQPDLQLSKEFADANDLVGYRDEDGEKRGGYFSKNRRVKVQRFRGERSEGFWIPVTSLDNVLIGKYDLNDLKDGDLINEYAGIPICNKYVTPSTLKVQKGQFKKLRRKNQFFHKHKNTAQFRDEGQNIPIGSMITVTEKLHGTSARVGRVLDDMTVGVGWFKLFLRILTDKPKFEQRVIVGSRNVLLKDPDRLENSYYGSEEFRYKHAERFQNLLHENEIIYYELVGYDHNGGGIMNSHSLVDNSDSDLKELRRTYGETMEFSYGNTKGQCSGYVYRITNVSPEGNEYDLTDSQMRQRCIELGLDPVPILIRSFIYNGDLSSLTETLVSSLMLEGASILDSRHIREGIAVRIDNENGASFMKIKSFSFCQLEGIEKSFIGFVDREDIS